jgi:hypothetical protein
MSEIAGHSKGCAQTRSPAIQAKLTVSQPADAHEQEADRVANAVIRMPEPSMQERPAVSPAVSPNQVQRLCAECDEEHGKKTDAPVQRKEQTAEALPVPQSAAANIQPLRGGGSELPASTRAFFEPRFGADFSHVRVHTDPRAEEAAKSIGAKAFTLGNDIAFASGQYSPDSAEGRTLLAHELAHVTQASVVNGVIHRKPAGGAPGGHELSDAELLALANLAPVRVEGSSDKRIEDVLIAANNGLIDIVTPSEFEHQLRFRVERLGSTEFADSWTNDERFSFSQAGPGDQRAQLAAKWVSFIERGYMAYLADKAAQWRSATRRMHTAAVIGNVIGQVTVTAATLFIGGGGAGAARGGGGTALARETSTTVLKREVEAVARNRAAEFADKAVRLATKVVPSPDTDKDKRRKKRDTCETLWGLSPGENARIFEQRAPIRGETTVDHVRFRLDRGIPPPRGGATTRGSQEWTRRIGCPSDDAGHVLANRFGGFAFYNNQYGNIFPQTSRSIGAR